MSGDAITTVGLSKHYLDREALAPLDLVVPSGERVTLVGHNGSGKTTLLAVLAGTIEPTAGTASVFGFPAGSREARALVSWIADRPVFYDDLSVWEHLEYTARLHGTDDWEQHGVDLLDGLGILDRADDLPATFSRGLMQKTAIALAFARPFELLLVDEPFVGLDRTGREALLDLLASAHRDGASLVVATHDLTTAGDGDRVVALSGGVLTFDGAPGDADVVALAEGRTGAG